MRKSKSEFQPIPAGDRYGVVHFGGRAFLVTCLEDGTVTLNARTLAELSYIDAPAITELVRLANTAKDGKL